MKNKILLLSTLLAGLFLLNSCLKDDHDYWKDDVEGKMYATVLVPTLQTLGLQPVAGDVEFSFMVNIASSKVMSHDVTINLAVDNAALTDYNTRTGKSFLLYPNIEVLTPTITVPKGSRVAYGKFKVWGANTLNACDNFIAPISIVSVSDSKIDIAANMKTCLVSLPIANPFSGNYDTEGYRIRPGNPTEPISAGTVTSFSTVDCKTVNKHGFGNYSAYDVKVEITTDVMVVGGVNCYKVICTVWDPATGLTVGGNWSTWHGDAASLPAPPANPTEINYYNPVTETFYLNAYYSSSAGDRIMWEVHKRKH